MKHTKSIIASVLLVGAVATTSVFAASSMGMTSKNTQKKGPFSNATVIKALQDKGITVPTAEEAKAFEAKMKAARDAEKNLSEADKASFKALRESFKKQEREFLRSKGVVLPTEDEIAKMELIRNTLEELKGTFKNGSGSLRMEGREEGRGMMKDKDEDDQKGPREGMMSERGGMMRDSENMRPGNAWEGRERGPRKERKERMPTSASGTVTPAPAPAN